MGDNSWIEDECADSRRRDDDERNLRRRKHLRELGEARSSGKLAWPNTARAFLRLALGACPPQPLTPSHPAFSLLNLQGLAPVYLVVDALDECPSTSALSSPREEVLTLLEDLIDAQLPNLRICVTSRPEADIMPVLEPLTFRSISLHDERGQKEDIVNYIKSVVKTNKRMRRWKPEHKQLVINILTERADGM